ncbi:hypothetical protein AA0113_g11012 [Alternaria arborescens]|uniref:Uncharacterized protein n=1 Tax=Alternaria arborescens TaxID=156630 RepID=A0A4Q4QGH6_9PLEO|nr:hypothetical protein AA0113_g11012 [Alternaria arborescens]
MTTWVLPYQLQASSTLKDTPQLLRSDQAFTDHSSPADLENRVVNCKAIDLVVKALRIAPGASKYCSSVLHVATTTVQTTSTSTTTSTNIVTTTITSTACPAPTAVKKREAFPITAVSNASPAKANQPEIQNCGGAPLPGFACSQISSACSCLNLPTPATTTTIPTTTTTTVASTITSCVPPPVPTCDQPFVCGADPQSCSGTSGCFCFGSDKRPICANIAGLQGRCSEYPSCNTDADCAAGSVCDPLCCGSGICYPVGTCTNSAAPSRMFRRRGTAGKGLRLLESLYNPNWRDVVPGADSAARM